MRVSADAMRSLSGALAAERRRARPPGRLALDVVAIGRRFADTVTAECSDDAPDADGTGGSAHRVMVVAGINSSGAAWDRGPTVALDVEALGYQPAEGEVRYYSYAADGGPYTGEATHGPIEVAGRRLDAQLRAMQREQPGREVDLIAHSQGGIVVDWFLAHVLRSRRPGRSRRSATWSRCRRRTRARRWRPPAGRSVRPRSGAPRSTRSRARRRSRRRAAPRCRTWPRARPLMRHLWDRGVPDHFDFTTIGATEDLVVPATQHLGAGRDGDGRRGDGINEHSAIVRAPDALRAVRAALEGRPPPCVGLFTALRRAVAPVVISRVEHTIGSGTAAILGGAVG